MKSPGLLLAICGLIVICVTMTSVTAGSRPSVGTEVPAAPGARTECGDADGDGNVYVTDFVYTMHYIFHDGPAPMNMAAVDVDLCGSLNWADLTYLLEYLYAGGPPPCEGSVTCVQPTGANQVRLGVPITAAVGDTFDLPIYITNDTPLRGLTLGFSYNSEHLEILDTNFTGSVWTPTIGRFFKNDQQNHQVLIGCADGFGQLAPQGDGLLTTLRVVMHPPFLGESPIDIDSTFIGPGGEFIFCPVGGGVITPAYVDNGEEDIVLNYGNFDISVVLNGGENVAYTGQTNLVELWFKNAPMIPIITSMQLGFRFDLDCNYEFVGGHGTGTGGYYTRAEGDAVGAWNVMFVENPRIDNASPDTIGMWGLAMTGGGLPSHYQHALCYTMAITIPSGEPAVEDGFCIDNILLDPEYLWLLYCPFPPPFDSAAPCFQGYLNTSVHDPDAPAFCFDIVTTYVCGDADGNEIVNISDAVYLISYIFGGGPAPDPLESGDCDCNSIVNISDAVYLIAYIFGGGPAPCAGCK